MPGIHEHPQARVQAARQAGFLTTEEPARHPTRDLATPIIGMVIGSIGLLIAIVMLAVIGAAYVVAIAVASARTPWFWLGLLSGLIVLRMAGVW